MRPAVQDKRISINCIDKTIVVDGIGYQCPDMPDCAEGTRALQWDPAKPKPGSCECHDSHKFSDFTLVAHFLPHWQEARKAEIKRLTDLEADEQAKTDAMKKAQADEAAQAAAFKAARAKRKAHDDAMRSLETSDWQIIRAIERKLAADGLIDDKLVKAREAARKTVEQERKKL
jgi:hypothetical protein